MLVAEVSWEEPANLAWKGNALDSLAGMLRDGGLAPRTHVGLLYRGVLQDLMVAFLGCFNLSLSGLPGPSLSAILDVFEGIYQGDLPY